MTVVDQNRGGGASAVFVCCLCFESDQGGRQAEKEIQFVPRY